MSRERHIRIIALRNVLLGGDAEYIIRERIRWYARTYGIAPHIVARDVPLDDVLLDYWESYYRDLRDSPDGTAAQALTEERRLLTLTPEELAAEERNEMDEDARLDAELARMAAEEEDDTPPKTDPSNPFESEERPPGLPPDVEFKFDLGDDAAPPNPQSLGR